MCSPQPFGSLVRPTPIKDKTFTPGTVGQTAMKPQFKYPMLQPNYFHLAAMVNAITNQRKRLQSHEGNPALDQTP